MKIRCPADDGRDPGAHLALDVRLPLRVCPAMTALARLKCACGKALVIDARPQTPPVGGAP